MSGGDRASTGGLLPDPEGDGWGYLGYVGAAGMEPSGARMGMVEQFGNERWSERSQIYFVNDKRLS